MGSLFVLVFFKCKHMCYYIKHLGVKKSSNYIINLLKLVGIYYNWKIKLNKDIMEYGKKCEETVVLHYKHISDTSYNGVITTISSPNFSCFQQINVFIDNTRDELSVCYTFRGRMQLQHKSRSTKSYLKNTRLSHHHL